MKIFLSRKKKTASEVGRVNPELFLNLKASRWCLTAAIFFLSACRITFEGLSLVQEDGTIERTTQFHASSEADQKEILSWYELPAGGQWQKTNVEARTQRDQEKANKKIFTYQADSSWTPSRQPGRDFKRKSKIGNQAAQNHFSVRIWDGWFIKWFDYEEHFQDVVDQEQMRVILREIFEQGLKEFLIQLQILSQENEVVAKCEQILRQRYEPLWNRAIEVIQKKGFQSEEFWAFSRQIEPQFEKEAVWQYLVKHIPEWDQPDKKVMMQQAYEAMESLLNEKKDHLEEIILGVHGFTLFQNYDFKLRLRLPGKMIETNGRKDEKNKEECFWEFDHTQLNQTLKARSFKIYPFRLTVIVLLGILVLIIIGIFWRRRMNIPYVYLIGMGLAFLILTVDPASAQGYAVWEAHILPVVKTILKTHDIQNP